VGRKKREKSTDAAKDFFGDSDIDWLDDEDERMPVAPPPPPPLSTPPVKTATPLAAGPSEEWAQKVSEAPADKKGLASAPTLIFSSVPTLPPMPSPMQDAPKPTNGGGPPAPSAVETGPLALDRGPLTAPETEEVETVEVARTPGPPPAAPPPEPPESPSSVEPPTAPTEMIPVPASDAEVVLPASMVQSTAEEAHQVYGDALEGQRTDVAPASLRESPGSGPVRVQVPDPVTPGPTLRRATKPPSADRIGVPPRRAPSEPPVLTVQAPSEGMDA
jgi:hypothetical protein